MARAKGFKGIVALQGDTGLALAREYKPDAIMLDIRLPVMDGWTVLNEIKQDPQMRHIPVHIITVEEGQQRGMQQGAIAYLKKPVSTEMLDRAFAQLSAPLAVERSVIGETPVLQLKHLLVVEDDDIQRHTIVERLGNSNLIATAVATAQEALTALRVNQFDCIVVDLKLPDMSGFELIQRIREELKLWQLPIIVYTGKELTATEDSVLKRLADNVIVKGDQSIESLLAKTANFLNQVQTSLPMESRGSTASSQEAASLTLRELGENFLEGASSASEAPLPFPSLQEVSAVLTGKKVLIVDDDVRNVFALTSMLERYQMQVIYAENGSDGIKTVQNTPDIQIVLMDVMMPEMDGYETMRAIRNIEQFKSLPMIALTAKAMKGDREKCIEAGASDYITKPVDTEQLLSLLCFWLDR